MKRVMMVLAIGTVVLGSNTVVAQLEPMPAPAGRSFGRSGQVVIGVDRVMGLAFETWTSTSEEDVGGNTYEATSAYSQTHVALLGSQHFLFGGVVLNSAALVPRLGVDVFATDGLSLGLSAMYLTSSGEIENDSDVPGSTSQTEDTPTSQTLVVNPRIGYAIPVAETVAIWPRLGFTYASFSVEEEDGSTVSVSTMQLNVEGLLAISPVPHFAFLVGPFGDIGLGGSVETEFDDGTGGTMTDENDLSGTAFGLAAGIVGYFP